MVLGYQPHPYLSEALISRPNAVAFTAASGGGGRAYTLLHDMSPGRTLHGCRAAGSCIPEASGAAAAERVRKKPGPQEFWAGLWGREGNELEANQRSE